MGGFDHQAQSDDAPERVFESQHRASRNARIGMLLFLTYLAFYGAFVLINTFRPELMDRVPAAGVNLAIWYGFALIVVALALALVYAWVCRAGQVSNLTDRLQTADGPDRLKTCPTKTEGRP